MMLLFSAISAIFSIVETPVDQHPVGFDGELRISSFVRGVIAA